MEEHSRLKKSELAGIVLGSLGFLATLTFAYSNIPVKPEENRRFQEISSILNSTSDEILTREKEKIEGDYKEEYNQTRLIVYSGCLLSLGTLFYSIMKYNKRMDS